MLKDKHSNTEIQLQVPWLGEGHLRRNQANQKHDEQKFEKKIYIIEQRWKTEHLSKSLDKFKKK